MTKYVPLLALLLAASGVAACVAADDGTPAVDEDGLPSESQASDLSACSAFPSAVHHRVKPSNGASLYTLSASEAANAAQYGFTEDRGTPFYVKSGTGTGLSPVYRLYKASTGDFMWTINAAERASAVANYGYVDQGVNFYASPAPQTCLVPVYRFVDNVTAKHRFAVSKADRDALTSAGWRSEGISFYAAPEAGVPTPDAGTPPTDAGNPADPKFSFLVIPDTQQEIVYKPNLFTNRVSWILAQRSSMDIRFVTHTGDMVDWDTPDHIHYVRAADGLQPLNTAHLPYAIAVGNHDTAAVCQGGSACPGNVNANLRNTTTYNTYFPASRFEALGGQYEAGKMDNAFHTFSAGGVDWLVLNLELWARTGAVDWAKTVLASHPKHNVIFISHSHLTGSSTIESSNGGYGNNSPQYVYDNLLKQYANVRLVFSGHVGTSGFREDTGVNGNKIYQFLNCFHDGTTNPTRIVEIDTAANTLNTRVYAPFNDTTRSDGTKSLGNIAWVRP